MAVRLRPGPSPGCTLRSTASASPRRAAALRADKPPVCAFGMSAAPGLQEAYATCRPCAIRRQTVRRICQPASGERHAASQGCQQSFRRVQGLLRAEPSQTLMLRKSASASPCGIPPPVWGKPPARAVGTPPCSGHCHARACQRPEGAIIWEVGDVEGVLSRNRTVQGCRHAPTCISFPPPPLSGQRLRRAHRRCILAALDAPPLRCGRSPSAFASGHLRWPARWRFARQPSFHEYAVFRFS
jgi:hypothetical protein